MATTINLKIIGMHCTACAMNIDGELEDTEGVQKAVTNYTKQLTEVTYDEKQIDKNKIIETVKKAGYTANPI